MKPRKERVLAQQVRAQITERKPDGDAIGDEFIENMAQHRIGLSVYLSRTSRNQLAVLL